MPVNWWLAEGARRGRRSAAGPQGRGIGD